ncbi:MAG TPA: R3H domain-containing nucleic acid-binding protein [Candidatus Paceibacterota bacterium]
MAEERTIETIIEELLASMGHAGSSVVRSDVAGQVVFSIRGSGDARELIGMHGDTIHAIDTLVKKIAEKRSPSDAMREGEPERDRTPMFLVDVDDYRSKQIKDLEMKAKMMAERARSLRYDVELSPMSAYERLIVHTALAKEPNVTTESQGEGRSRRVVIKYSAT